MKPYHAVWTALLAYERTQATLLLRRIEREKARRG